MSKTTGLTLPFHKMHGLGNDFVLIDSLTSESPAAALQDIPPELARRLADRRMGVGCDQILWMRPAQDPSRADARMEIRNADGSVAEMCGNGIRCAALFLREHSVIRGRDEYRIETLDGIKGIRSFSKRNGSLLFRVDMGVPRLGAGYPSAGVMVSSGSSPAGSRTYKVFEVNTGVPHAMIFVSDVDAVDLEADGAPLERHPQFKEGANIDFVQVMTDSHIRVRVWERGAGPTMACGTGACAAGVATIATGRGRSPLTVSLPGGDLEIEWGGEGQSVWMTGPAEWVYGGVIS